MVGEDEDPGGGHVQVDLEREWKKKKKGKRAVEVLGAIQI